jgi:pyruvate dehydrogenase E2 component (dihydrolipoamide acetyltransferase)
MAATAIVMPRLGMTMEEGTVVEWPVATGGPVSKGATVLVIESEKAESEIEATASGVLRHVFVLPGQTVACGTLLAAITDAPDEPFDADSFAATFAPPEPPRAEGPRPEVREREKKGGEPGRARGSGERRPVAPAARALAKKHGVALERVAGTGPNGRVTLQDVESFLAARERLVVVEDGVALEVLRAARSSEAGAEARADPVVLLPGFGSDASSFALVVPTLAKDFDVLCVNPRGIGASDAPDLDVYEVGRAADDVAAVLEAPAHVVGASLGAATAVELALRHPAKIRSLCLITPFASATPRLLAFARAWQRVAAEATPETVALFLAPWLFGDALLADEARRARTLRGLAESARRANPETLARAAAGMAAWSGSRESDLPRIDVPTLVLAAGADLLTPDARTLAERIPGSECQVVPGCGHALAIEAPEAVVQRVLAHARAVSTERTPSRVAPSTDPEVDP